MDRGIAPIKYFFLLFFLSLPAYAQGSSRPGGKSLYLSIMIVLCVLLVLLFIWELIDWIIKKKMQQDTGTGVVSVVEEETQEDDPFKMLLQEESVQTAAYRASIVEKSDIPEQPVRVKSEEENPPERARPTQELVITDMLPPPTEVMEEKKQRRKIHVEVEAESIMESSPPLPAAEEKIPVSIDEQGWSDLMQKASREKEEKIAMAAEEPKSARIVREVRPVAITPPPPDDDDDDPWKALLKKSKEEVKVTRDEDKPWSSLLKSEKSVSPERNPLLMDEKASKPQQEKELQVPVLKETAVDSILTTPVSDDISPLVLEKSPASLLTPPSRSLQESPSLTLKSAEPHSLSTEREEEALPPEETKPLQRMKDAEIKPIDLKSMKKKEDESDEKKSSSKESIPVFMKKASRIISIPSSGEKTEESDEAKPGVLSTGREQKRVIKLDGLSFDKKDKDEENS